MYWLYINLGCRFALRMQKLHYEEFIAIFPISLILVIRSTYAKQNHFQYLLYFKIYGIYMNLGCRFEFRTQKLPYERISGNFFYFIDFGHQVGVSETKSFSILAVFQNVWDFINLGCRFEFRTQKFPYGRISGNFSDFIDFGHQARVCKTRSFLNISCNSKCMGFI